MCETIHAMQTVDVVKQRKRESVPLAGIVLLLITAVTIQVRAVEAEDTQPATHISTVGVFVKLEQVVLPGSQIEALPLDDDQRPVVVRIIESFPHGTDYRYDFEYYGLDPGEYDLRDYLRRQDGTAINDLPPMPIKIVSLLPAGQVQPNPLAVHKTPRVGGYRSTMISVGLIWLLVLLCLLFGARQNKKSRAGSANSPVTFAERLRPAIDAAIAGDMTSEQHSELELMLVTFWRRKLNMDNLPMDESLRRLREHEEAGPLLRQLEDWLHRPSANESTVDVPELLRPYQGIPADPMN